MLLIMFIKMFYCVLFFTSFLLVDEVSVIMSRRLTKEELDAQFEQFLKEVMQH